MIAITIDVEDWPQSTWDHSLPITARSARNTERLLALLDDAGCRATFFVLGLFAEAFPDVVRAIAAAGHEVASHGHGHIEIFTQTRDEFRADVVRAKSFLEDLLGSAVEGYRAPDFSIVEDTLWALDELAAAGFTYDSSVFPVRAPRYGIPDWPAHVVRVELPSGASIVELPIATMRLGGRALPVGGGGYHRLLPAPLIVAATRRSLAENDAFVAYAHPYEFDARELREIEPALPLKTRLHQGLGRRGFERKFRRLVCEGNLVLARDLAASVRAEHSLRTTVSDGSPS